MGRICYQPCQTACNRAQLDEAVGINAVERYLGDAAIAPAGTGAGRPADRAARGRRRVRPGRADRGVPPAPPRARRHGPRVPARSRRACCATASRATGCRATCWTPRSTESSRPAIGSSCGRAGRGPRRAACGGGGRRRRAGGRGAAGPAHVPAGRGRRQGPRRGATCCTTWRTPAASAARPARRRLRRRQHSGRRRAHRAPPRRHRHADRLSPHPRADARRSRRGGRGGGGGRPAALAVHDQRASSRHDHRRAHGARRHGFPRPTGEVERLGPTAWCWPWAGVRPRPARRPSRSGHDGVVESDPSGATGEPGVFAGGDVVGGGAHRDRSRRAGRRAALAADAWLRGEPVRAPTRYRYPKRPLNGSTPGTSPTRRTPCGPGWRPPGARTASTRWSAGSPRTTRATRRGAACRAATASSATTATAYCPDDAIVKLGPGLGFAVDLTTARAAASARRMPGRRDRHGHRAGLSTRSRVSGAARGPRRPGRTPGAAPRG